MKRIVREAEQIPRGYGFAYERFHFRDSVYYPIPLNWLVAVSLRVYYFLARGIRDRKLHEVWQVGFNQGLEVGKVMRRREVIRELKAELDEDIREKRQEEIF